MQRYIALLFVVCLLLAGCTEAAKEARLAEQQEQARIQLLESNIGIISVETELTKMLMFEKGAAYETIDILKAAQKVSDIDTQNHTAFVIFDIWTASENLYFPVTKAPDNEEKLYIQQGEDIYELNAEEVYALLNRLITDIEYIYSEPPKAFMAVGENEPAEMAVTQGSYSYALLDGSKKEAEIENNEPAVITAQKADKLAFSLSHIIDENCCETELTAAILFEDEQVWQGTPEALEDFEPEKSGLYTVEISGTHSEKDRCAGEFTWQALVDWRMPLRFVVESSETNPGELVVIRALNVPKGEQVSFTSSNIVFEPVFFEDGNGGMITVIPFASSSALGDYFFTLKCGDVAEDYKISLEKKDFVVQKLIVSEDVANDTINSDAANIEYRNAIAPLRPVRDPVAYWTEDFIWPIYNPAQRSTQFGTIRYVNDSPAATRHNAIDFNLPQGTPVHATNRGRVLYAGFLQLTGNTVLIEHGYGVKSWYYHMYSLENIKTGDIVERDQKIGEIGTTGFSTGPHLHFEMTVTNIAVNPETIIVDRLLTR